MKLRSCVDTERNKRGVDVATVSRFQGRVPGIGTCVCCFPQPLDVLIFLTRDGNFYE